MTGRFRGPASHEAHAGPPGPGHRSGPGLRALRRGRRSARSRPGGAATRGHLAPAYHRFSVPQGRPPLPGRWRRGSGCKEALGLTQRKKPLPGPAVASRLRLPCPRRGRAAAAQRAAHMGPRATAGGAAAGPAPPRRSPAMCSILPIDVFAKRKKNPHPNIFSFPPTSCFVSPFPLKPALSAQRPALPRGTSLLRAIPGRRRRGSGAGYAGLFLSRLCT